MSIKPHILYWKWNDDLLDKNTVRERTEDIMNRSMFDVIYVSLHSVSPENRIASNPLMLESVRECAELLKSRDRKMVLDLDISYETEYAKINPTCEKSYLAKYCRRKLDGCGCFTEDFEKADGIYFCKCLSFDDRGLFDEKSVFDITERAEVKNNTVKIDAGCDFAECDVIFYVYMQRGGYDILGDEYKEKWEEICRLAAGSGISGIAADEWGLGPKIETESGEQGSWDTISEMASDCTTDLSKVKFFAEWFVVTDGLCRYYNEMFYSDLKEDLLYFRNDSADRQKGIRIVNQYLDALRKRTADGEKYLYELSKKYFGEDSVVLCHPTWWGDELDPAFDVIKNGIDWWEVKKDFAQTDELMLMPVRISRTRRCPENLWYNMWYSMRTLDINTYYRETWVNARYGGRTHYLGYECYEPGVVLNLNQKNYLEKCSETEEKIEILNLLQTSRPDSRILIVFGYEAVANWKIADPDETRWNRVSGNIHNVWKFTKDLFDSHYLCDLIPSTEIDNDYVGIENNKICYCGHNYDMLVYILPEGNTKKTADLIKNYANANKNLIIIGNNVNFMSGYGLLNEKKIDVKKVIHVLEDRSIKRNCGENYCVYEDGSVLFTSDGEKNIGNILNIDEEINEMKIRHMGEDFLYVLPQNGGFAVSCGKCNFLEITRC